MNGLRIRSHDDLIAAVPHVLSFHPESSLVCFSLDGGPTARMDLPESPEELKSLVDVVSDVYRRHPTGRVALLAFGDDGRDCLKALSALGDAVAGDGRGPAVGPMLWVNGDEWFDVLGGTTGTVAADARLRMAAEFAVMGRPAPTARRSDLTASLRGDPAPVALHLEAAAQRVDRMDLASLHAEAEWFGSRLDVFLQDQSPLSDVDAARVLAAVGDGGVRTAAELRMSRTNAAVHAAFWRDLVRRAPHEVRDLPSAMLALSSYLDGRGAQAWVALDEITGERPPLADLVAEVLEKAINPDDLEHAMRTAAAGTLMQQAALRDQILQARNGPGHETTLHRGPDGPAPSAPRR